MSKTALQAEKLFNHHFGSKQWNIVRVRSGRFSETFEVDDGEDSNYILRVAPPDAMLQLFYEYRMMRQEPNIHEQLLNETAVPVPGILVHDFTHTLIDRDYLILNRLEGKPLNQAGLSIEQSARALYQWGDHVRSIHSITDSENHFGYLGEHRCMEPQETWAKAFAVMYRNELDNIISTGIYDKKTGDFAYDLLEENLHRFNHCPASRLLHGDLWITNLLVDDNGNVTGILDFDRACWGDIEMDLAIAEYCGITRPPFRDGYGKCIDTHSGDAWIRRMFYLLYDHQKYIIISLSARRKDPRGAERYAVESLNVMENFRDSGMPLF